MLVLMPGRKRVLSEAIASLDDLIREGGPRDAVLLALDRARQPLRQYFRSRLRDGAAANALTLKVLNLLLAKYHFRRRSTEVLSRPFGLLVDPSNGCNLACPGCVQSTRAKSLRLFDWKNGLLTPDRFEHWMEQFGPCVMQIMFCNYGEPITNPDTPLLIDAAKRYYAQTALSTNLSLPRFDAEAYVRSGLDFMYLAIDGASQSVYSRYRKNGDISLVYRNVEALVAAKQRLGKKTPVLRWQYLAFEHNAQEIELALEKARALGVDQFVVETPFDVSWDDPGVHPAADVRPFRLELTPNTEQLLGENWETSNMGAAAERIERDLERGWHREHAGRASTPEQPAASNWTCSWLYKSTTIDANGRILPCCGAPKPGANLVFGNLNEPTSDPFNSDHYAQARRFFADRPSYEATVAAGGATPYCAVCEWDQTHIEFGPEQAAQYLRTAAKGTIDPATIERCSNW
jgi:MoaA/NifB/PqqE/SkfB family radical SAM enzyme